MLTGGKEILLKDFQANGSKKTSEGYYWMSEARIGTTSDLSPWVFGNERDKGRALMNTTAESC
jgi:hypothetical protein